jgi:hypothetical protein
LESNFFQEKSQAEEAPPAEEEDAAPVSEAGEPKSEVQNSQPKYTAN